MIRIITDSTSSIPCELRRQYDLDVLSLFVNREGIEYEEATMDLDAFYADIQQMIDNIPTSSQPAASQIEKSFEDAAKAGDDVLGIFISSKMSGTFEGAVRAARHVAERYPSFRFAIIDGMTNCMELGWAVLSAARSKVSGCDLESCMKAALQSTLSTRFIFAPESLRFLEKGGRIGKASALLGNMLSISPILTVKDGMAATFSKVRTQKKALSKMIEIFEQDVHDYGLKNIAVHYIGSREPAEKWAHEIIEPLVGHDVLIAPASPVIGVHVGPAMGIAYECARPFPDKFSLGSPEVVTN